MLIRDHYRDPAVLGNEQVLTPVGSRVERKDGLGEEEEGIKRVLGGRWEAMALCSSGSSGVGRALH